MNLGKKIVKLRKDKKLSQEDFAEIFNVSRQTVSSWENSKSYPDIETIVMISDKFDISLDNLLKDDKELIQDINNKIKTSTKLKRVNSILTFALIMIVICVIIFSYDVYNSFFKKKDYYTPGTSVICTYKDQLVEYKFKSGKQSYVSSFSLHEEYEEIKNLYDMINKKSSEFNNTKDYMQYIKETNENIGAKCEIVEYTYSSEYAEIIDNKQKELYEYKVD